MKWLIFFGVLLPVIFFPVERSRELEITIDPSICSVSLLHAALIDFKKSAFLQPFIKDVIAISETVYTITGIRI